MACSICQQKDHNARTCPNRDMTANGEERDHALWLRFDNITRSEARELQKGAIDLKDEIAPEARGVWARANKKDLPTSIQRILGNDEEGR